MSKFSRIIGKRIAYERKEQDLSQEKLAELSRLNVSYISAVECGRYSVGIDNLKKICKALKYPMSELFRGYWFQYRAKFSPAKNVKNSDFSKTVFEGTKLELFVRKFIENLRTIETILLMEKIKRFLVS